MLFVNQPIYLQVRYTFKLHCVFFRSPGHHDASLGLPFKQSRDYPPLVINAVVIITDDILYSTNEYFKSGRVFRISQLLDLSQLSGRESVICMTSSYSL